MDPDLLDCLGIIIIMQGDGRSHNKSAMMHQVNLTKDASEVSTGEGGGLRLRHILFPHEVFNFRQKESIGHDTPCLTEHS